MVENVDISVIVPTKNEQITVGNFIKWCQEGFFKAGLNGEIILVDNSEDKTREIAESLGAKVIVVQESGLGNAYRAAQGRALGRCHLDDYLDLDCWWVIASQHLMHFSKVRTPEDIFLLAEADLEFDTLKGEGERFFMLALDFLDHLQEIDHEDHEAWVIALNNLAEWFWMGLF
jgi:glycosyltransferase involved in cell wall biosynthesis